MKHIEMVQPFDDHEKSQQENDTVTYRRTKGRAPYEGSKNLHQILPEGSATFGLFCYMHTCILIRISPI